LGTTTGGGISSIYNKPSYQRDLPQTFTTLFGATVRSNGRLVPDVSFNSAVNGGWLAPLGFLTYPNPSTTWVVFGGTSAAAPAWAAIIALVNQIHGSPVGFVNPAIYSLAESKQYSDLFHDVKVGQNSLAGSSYAVFAIDGYSAGRGYDLTTGWGTPIVSELVPALSNAVS